MKRKIIFLLFILFFVDIVMAEVPANLYSIVNKCNIVNDNETKIHVDVISPNDGFVAFLLDKYRLAKMDNNEEFEITFTNLESQYIKQVNIDALRDENSRSYVNLYFDNSISIKSGDSLVSFDINIKFKDKVPDTIVVFDNEIVLTEDSNLCTIINGYKTEVISIDKKNNNIFLYIIGGLLVIFEIIELIYIFKIKR